jgi:hypothetical protein
MSEITAIVEELKSLSSEIKTRNAELTKLRKRKKDLDDTVIKFLEEKNQPGVKYRGLAVIAEEKMKRKPKKKSQKMDDCISVLQGHRVDNPERVLKDIIETMKGDEVESKTVKITSVLQKK